jgi:alpha,alpha-trehalose phosphorylase
MAPADSEVSVGAVARTDHAEALRVEVDPWRVAQRRLDAAQAARDETVFALANGALGVRGGVEEIDSPTQATFLAGVWERTQIHYHERHPGFARSTDTRVPVPDAIRLRIFSGDIDIGTGEPLAFERVLDMRRGRLDRSTRWRLHDGSSIDVFAERFVSARDPGLLCLRLSIRSVDFVGTLHVESSIIGSRQAAAQGDDPRVGAGSGSGMHIVDAHADPRTAHLVQRTQASGIAVVCAQRHRLDDAVCFTHAYVDAGDVHQVFAGALTSGAALTIEKFAAYAWSTPGAASDVDELNRRAETSLSAALELGFDRLADAHAAELAKFWQRAELAIDGEPAIEQALRFNLFHVHQSASRDGSGSVAAKGLTGEGYEGHIFWDAETFVLPALALLAPELARAMLEYRFRTLDHARAHAREMNHARGALYAWRTISGDECSAHYPSGSAQYHINAAIAYAIKVYVDASEDVAFLDACGAEMLVETARIWLDIGHFNPRRNGAFCIHEVTGPDEYTALVNNNYYTNRMAQSHLRYAAMVVRRRAAEAPVEYAAFAERLALDDAEIKRWLHAAETMYLPYDADLGVYAQDDEFLDKPVWDFAATPRSHYPLLMHYHPLTVYRHQVCKQADVLLALALAGGNVEGARKQRCFDYYEPITVHDSTLSASTFAIVAAEVGHADKAYRYFLDTLRVDLDDLHHNTGHGAHMAAMAGSWLALAWGFGGLRIEGGVLAFDPTLPPSWRSYRFGIVWKGRALTVEVGDAQVRYTLNDGVPLDIAHAGRHVLLLPGAPQVLPRVERLSATAAALARSGFPRPIEALIFDLDGVLADTARAHQTAWKRLAGELGLPFDEAIGERLKGVDRATSLEIVLGSAAEKYTKQQKHELAERKNGYYRTSIAQFDSQHLLPGAHRALVEARAAGLKIGLASASRSARELVERLGIAEFFDYIADAGAMPPKPDPGIFLAVAAALGVEPSACLGIEDASAGVAAIKAAGMAALGIGDARVLGAADAVLPSLAAFDLVDFVSPRP